MKRNILFLLVIILFLTPGCGDKNNQQGPLRMVTTLDGSQALIPSYPQRIACFYNPAYDKIVMLSKGSRIALMPADVTPWALRFYPELAGIPVNTAEGIPDVERLLKLDVDLVFYPKGRCSMEKVTQAGIAALCPFNDKYVPSTMDEYTAEFKRQIKFFSEVLGSETREKAGRYCSYLEDITKRIGRITSKIPRSRRPRVYYGKMNDLCSTQGNNTIMRWYTELAGGIYIPKSLDKYFATVNMEQVFSWDPDIVLLGMYGSFKPAPDTMGLDKLRAYREGKVFRVPAGVFCWDMTSCETALLPLFLGKKFHPALFKGWDIVKEMKKFYFEIYGVKITADEAERIFAGLPPL